MDFLACFDKLVQHYIIVGPATNVVIVVVVLVLVLGYCYQNFNPLRLCRFSPYRHDAYHAY